jgi:hypothetical protein
MAPQFTATKGLPARSDLGQRLLARDAGHHQVQEDDVGRAAGGKPFDGLVAAFGMRHEEALALQHRLDQAALRRIVIDDEDRLGHVENTHLHRTLVSFGRGSCWPELIQGRRKGGVSETRIGG